MTRKKTTRLTALLLLLLVVGCGTEGRYSEDDIEYQLASIDAGKKLGLSDPAIDAYASALDDLETRCGDDRRFLGDMATKAVEILERDAGVSYSTFEVLEGL